MTVNASDGGAWSFTFGEPLPKYYREFKLQNLQMSVKV